MAVVLRRNLLNDPWQQNNIIGGKEEFCDGKKVRQVELKKSNFSRESFKEQMEVSVLEIKDRELQKME